MNKQQYVHSQASEEFESERVALLERVLDPMTVRHLDALGVAEGWNCLEVGAGKGSVAIWLAKRVGFRGKVLAIDIDTKFLRDLGIHNLDVCQSDIVKNDLEENQYDVVHCRALLTNLAHPEKALEQMVRVTKPGGWLLIEEPDFSSLGAIDPSYPSADLFNDAYRIGLEAFKKGGYGDACYGRCVRYVIECLGFSKVGYDGSVHLCRGGSEPETRFLDMTGQAARRTLESAGLLTMEHNEALRRLYQDPEFYFTGPTWFGGWGRRP